MFTRAIRKASSCKEGTVFKNLNIYAGKQEPVAMRDDQYPTWLWELSQQKKTTFGEQDLFSREYLRYLSKRKIKANALKKKF
jgi:large subunit ribosomal protein L54